VKQNQAEIQNSKHRRVDERARIEEKREDAILDLNHLVVHDKNHTGLCVLVVFCSHPQCSDPIDYRTPMFQL